MSTLAVFKAIPLPHLSLLLSVAMVIAPHLARLPVWLGALCVGAILWRALHDAGRVRLPGRWLRLAILILGVAGLAVSFHTIVGQHAGSALVVMLLSLKLLEMNSQRDITVVIFLSFFVIVIGFLFSQSMFTGAYMIVTLLALITTLIAFQHRPPLRANAARLKRDAGHAVRLFAQALPIALLAFVIFPRVPGPLWGLPQDAGSARTGLSEEMEPGRISRLADSNEVAFRVKFDGAPPASEKLYWRGPVLWHFDGRKWTAPRDKFALRSEFDFTKLNEAIEYEVTLEPHNRNWMFALDLPALVPDDARLTDEFQLLSRRRIKEIKRYSMRSHTEYRLDALRRVNPERYAVIPDDAAPQTRELVASLRAQSQSNAEYVQQVLGYFREQPFYYSREAPLLFNDPVDEFLFDTRVGFCEHYASTFTVIMRLGGVPARVVTGYQGGEMNPLSDYMIVRQSDAHAWSEVWLSGQGWVRLDPTSVIPPSRIQTTADLVQRQPQTRERIIGEQSWLGKSARQLGYAWDAVNNRWNQWVIGYNQDKQSAFFAALGIPEITWRGLTVILGIALGVACLLIAAVVFRPARGERDPAVRLYRRFTKKLARGGFAKRPSETPSQFCRRVAQSQPPLASAVGRVTRAYLQLRYAPTSARERETHLWQLREAIDQLAVPRA